MLKLRSVAAVVAVTMGSTAAAAIINVGPGDSIQAAIDAAIDGDEIVVAPGTYFETINFTGKKITVRSSGGASVTTIDGTGLNDSVVKCVSSLENSFTVLDGFTITGGFAAGGGGMQTSHSSPTVMNCSFIRNTANSGGGMSINSGNPPGRPVAWPTVTNCTFSGNMAIGSNGGGGMFIQLSRPTVTNCTFSGNTSTGLGGGGMHNNNNSSPRVTNCTFIGNTATSEGGGMFNRNVSNPTVTNCMFIGNTASALGLLGGGGMHNISNSKPTVTNCTFIENTADNGSGGGMNNNSSSPTVTNCTFSGNMAAGKGGGMVNVVGSTPKVTNCTFTENTAADGGGMYNQNGTTTVNNCILWNDFPNEITEAFPLGVAAVRYSNVQDGWIGIGNINDPPVFVDPLSGDFRLQCGSPCIDAGHNWAVPSDSADLDGDGDTTELTPLDLDGNPRFADDPATIDMGSGIPVVVDMGAYERLGVAASCIILGDANGDGSVNVLDLVKLLMCFGDVAVLPASSCSLADFNVDDTVNVLDLIQLLLAFGDACP